MTTVQRRPDEVSEATSWQNLDEFIDDPQFEAIMARDFPREAAVLRASGMNRRQFMKVMGASLVMGGLTLSGCSPYGRTAQEEIIPYVRQPEEVRLGIPLLFATTMVVGGYGTGVILETHEGRPHRVEGNPNHPSTLGGGDVKLLASVIELYNPDRSNTIYNNGSQSTREAFDAALDGVISGLGDGSGLRILTELSTSPALAAQVEALVGQYPEARWYQYEPVARENALDGALMAFGEEVNAVYNFAEARTIVALDADFLSTMPGSLRYARDFASGRKVREGTTEMNRLYVVEGTPTLTGTAADHRLTIRSSDVEAFTIALAAALGVSGVEESEAIGWPAEFFEAVVNDLEDAGSNALVVAGDAQSPLVHALVHAINAELGSAGTTVTYTESANSVRPTRDLAALTGELSSGNIDALIIIGGNPAYNAPNNIPFVNALAAVEFSVHLSLYNDETSAACTWHVPGMHYLERWGDARGHDGTVSIIQPPIGPIFSNAISDHEIIARLMGDDRSAYTILTEYWEGEYSGSEDFANFWRKTLHDGVMADSAFEAASPSVNADFSSLIEENRSTPGEGLELVFRVDPSVYDGRYANNPWLQEMPDPLTKISWDTVAMMSAATAESLGVENKDLLDLTLNGQTMQAPAWIVPYHADNAVTVSLGYGTGIGGDVEAGLSFNAYTIRNSNAMWFTQGLEVSDTGRDYALALVQKEFDSRGTEAVRHATLEEFNENPDFSRDVESNYDATFLSEWDYEGYAWGMSIDLTSCIGCNACMIGCQSENNIPTVGKSEVLQERDLHWMRVDLYHEEGESYFQPVTCMHCENAPCEQVCPVQATVHDHEGINNMIYNRCVGTRACAANCPYSVRRFNWLDYTGDQPAILAEQKNPSVSVRVRGVMEKCTYCWQRISDARVASSRENRRITDLEVQPACAVACPTQAITFGNINDPNGIVSQDKAQPHTYSWLDSELNTSPRTTYLGRVTNPNASLHGEEGEA